MSVEAGQPRAIRTETLVFDGNMPTGAYADLDLTAYVGPTDCFVILKVYKDSVNNRAVYFRPNGATVGGGWYGISSVNPVIASQNAWFLARTTLGVVEWTADAAEQAKVYLEGVLY